MLDIFLKICYYIITGNARELKNKNQKEVLNYDKQGKEDIERATSQ